MTNQPNLKVWTGRHVELDLKYETGETEHLSLDIVPDNAADFDRGFLGESTPLARAILGKEAGEVVRYMAGDAVEARVISVSAELQDQPSDLSERRDEMTRKALQHSDDISAIIYASSMSNKWGEYDPGILQNDEGEQDKQA
jgi:hypothetical protein